MKDSYNTVDEWVHGKNYTVDEYMKIFEEESPWKSTYFIDGDNGPMIKVRTSPGDIMSKLFSDRTGIPLSGWKNPDKYDGNVLKTAGTLWSYAEKLLPNPVTGRSNTSELPDVFLGKFKDTSFLKDVFDFTRDNLITEVS